MCRAPCLIIAGGIGMKTDIGNGNARPAAPHPGILFALRLLAAQGRFCKSAVRKRYYSAFLLRTQTLLFAICQNLW